MIVFFGEFRAKGWHLFAGLCTAGLLLYWPTFGFGLTYFDDDILLRFRDFLASPSSFLEVFRRDILFSLDGSALYYRPLAALANVAQFQLGGGSLFVFRLVSLALHVLCAWWVFRLFSLLRCPGPAAYFFSLVFLLHPAAAQTVSWLPGVNSSLLGAALLPAFLLAAAHLESGGARPAVLHGVLFAASMFIKESAVGLVPACLLYNWLVLRRGPLKGSLPLFTGWAAGFGLWLLARSLVIPGGLPLTPGAAASSLFDNLPAVAAGAGYALLPFKIAVLAAAQDVGWGLGLASLALLAAGLLARPRGDLRRAAFGLGWFLCFLIPGLVSPHAAAANFMPQRIYLSLPGLLLAVMEILPVRALEGRRALAAGTAALLLLAAGSFRHSANYTGPLALWSRAASDSPASPLARVGLGTALTAAGRLPEAEGEFRKAVSLAPSDFGACHNLGVALAAQGRYAEALVQYGVALELKPDLAEAHLSRGVALAALGKPDAALESYARALGIAPHYSEAHYQAGFLLATAGRLQEAERGYRAALGLRPSYPEAHLNLAVLLGATGRAPEALGHYAEALRLKPDFAEAYYNRGVALAALGLAGEAAADYARALELRPGLAEARVNLGLMRAAEGAHGEALAQYAEALRWKPGLPVAHNSSGISLVRLGRLDEALAHFSEALRLDPSYPDPRRNIAVVNAMKKK